MRVKFTKDYKQYRKGQVVKVSDKVALGLVNSGVAIISKDMTQSDFKTKAFHGTVS